MLSPLRYGEKRSPYRRARACPSPCTDRGGQAPALRSGQRFDRGGQVPALREKTVPFTGGLGPSDATRACERVSLAMHRSRGTGPRATIKNGTLHRSDLGGQAPALRSGQRFDRGGQIYSLPCPTFWERPRRKARCADIVRIVAGRVVVVSAASTRRGVSVVHV